MTYKLIGAILAGGLILTSCANKSAAHNEQIDANEDTTMLNERSTEENSFESLRANAFAVTPEQLGLTLPQDRIILYGVIMDWEMGEGIATTVCYQTGDASVYLSTGGGIIGGGQHRKVNSAARQFVSLAQSFLDKATQTESTTLPATNEVWFYLLTNRGVFLGKENMQNFENNTSSWIELFEKGNEVVSELRNISEK